MRGAPTIVVAIAVACAVNFVAAAGDCDALKECATTGKVAMHRRFWAEDEGTAPYPFTSNGCGAGGLQVAVSPDLVSCCDLHDACYAVCNVSRSYCDNQFQVCLSNKCKRSGNPDCAQSARMLSTGAATFGCGAFQSAQKAVCDCGSNEEALERFKEAWQHLFRNVVGPSKPPATVDTTVAKMAANDEPPRRAYGALTKYPSKLIQREAKQGGADGDTPNLGSLFGLGDL